MRRFITLVLLGLSLTYVVPLIGFVLLRGLPAHAPWWLDLANAFTPYLFIPTLPLLLLAALSFSRSALLVCLLPVATFGILYGGLFLPNYSDSTATMAPESSFTMMTHNIYASNRDAERAAQVIAAADPDIVALQELTPEMAEALASRLGDRYQHQALLPRAGHSGVGVFSRFPIETSESFSLGRLAQHVVLNIAGQSVHLFNAHPFPPEIRLARRRPVPFSLVRDFDTEPQTEEVTTLLARVGRAEGPIIVAGDFNTTDQSRLYGLITRTLTDTHREAGWGFGHTFPAGGRFSRLPLAPFLRIDYIFHSNELKGIEARVGDHTGSDHLPVLVRLALKSPDRR